MQDNDLTIWLEQQQINLSHIAWVMEHKQCYQGINAEYTSMLNDFSESAGKMYLHPMEVLQVYRTIVQECESNPFNLLNNAASKSGIHFAATCIDGCFIKIIDRIDPVPIGFIKECPNNIQYLAQEQIKGILTGFRNEYLKDHAVCEEVAEVLLMNEPGIFQRICLQKEQARNADDDKQPNKSNPDGPNIKRNAGTDSQGQGNENQQLNSSGKHVLGQETMPPPVNKKKKHPFLIIIIIAAILIWMLTRVNRQISNIGNSRTTEEVITENDEADEEEVETEEVHEQQIIDTLAETGYLFPDGDSRFLTEEELYALRDVEGYDFEVLLGLARNEIYARHGYQFRSGGNYDAFYSNYDWYTSIPHHAVDDTEFNEYEIANRNLIVEIEKREGYRE